MTIKSLTITEEAYNAIKSLKHGDESFSGVLVRIAKEKKGRAANFFGALEGGSSQAKKWKEQIKLRRFEIEKEFKKRSEEMN